MRGFPFDDREGDHLESKGDRDVTVPLLDDELRLGYELVVQLGLAQCDLAVDIPVVDVRLALDIRRVVGERREKPLEFVLEGHLGVAPFEDRV